MKRRRFLLAVCLIAISLEIFPFTIRSQTETADPGGILRYGSVQVIGDVTPLVSIDIEVSRLHTMIYESLIRRDRISGDLSYRLAEKTLEDPQGISITFDLKNNIRWHDNHEFTSRDVMFSYFLVKNEKTFSPYKQLFEFVDNVKINGKYSITFNFKHSVYKPTRYFEALPILPAHLFEYLEPVSGSSDYYIRFPEVQLLKNPGGESTGTKLQKNTKVKITAQENGWLQVEVVGAPTKKGWMKEFLDYLPNEYIDFNVPANLTGTGPFVFKEVTSGHDILLSKNKNYFDEPAYLDFIRRNHSNDPETMISSLKQRNLELLCEVPFEKLSEINLDHIKKINYTSLSFSSIVFNCRKNPLLSEKNIRLAMVYGFNRRGTLMTFYGENQIKNLLAGPYSPYSWCINPDLSPLPYDKNGAKLLLVNKNITKPFKLLVNASEQSTKTMEVCEAFKSLMSEIGIPIELCPREKGAYQLDLKNGEFDLALVKWVLGPAYDIWPIFSSHGYENFGGYINNQVDYYLDIMKSSTNRDEIEKACYNLQDLLQKDAPHIFLWSLNPTAAVDTKVRGLNIETIDHYSIFSYANKWWIPAAER